MADKKRPRRRLVLVISVVLGIVIYALAVERTGVSLDEITSESRQSSLVRILRSLAQPELVTYDFETTTSEVDFRIPCQDGSNPDAQGQQLTVEPSCGEPDQVVTVRGTGYEPFQEGLLQFIPDSEFDVVLPLVRFASDENGRFEATVELPDRPSEVTQVIQSVVARRIGSWGNRQQVWTDTNENGVRDEGILGADGLTVVVESTATEFPAAALLDPTNQVTEFTTTGDAVIAVNGPASGVPADPIGTGSGTVSISSLTVEGSATVVTINGEDGADVSNWRVAVYDGATGEVLATEVLGDQIEFSPRISKQTTLTIDKIIDTVFLAFIATTVGLSVALPLSFIAARNLMRDVSTTVIGLGIGLLAVPVGVVAGSQYVELQRLILGEAIGNALLQAFLLGGGAVAIWALAQLLFTGGERRSTSVQMAILTASVVGMTAGLEGLFGLLQAGGEALREPFGVFGFVPGLFVTIGEVGSVLLPFLVGLGGAFIFVGLGNRATFWLNGHLRNQVRMGLGYAVMALAGATVGALLGALIDWLYQVVNPIATFVIPSVVGALLGLVMADVGRRSGEIRIGLTIYYISRTIFNTLRSIEPLVMVIVFVVWVGFGEFAGSLALALHTAAALAKLYSEQVESISEGPLEAVRATGATRLQTTIYSVVPQIVPPYIAFTMYRWDINVRLSTILGFAGGGGIGFLLQQNVQLGQYRAAAVQMLAIAIVVASLDYGSSRLRERFT